MAAVSTIPAYILANENLLFWMLSNPLSTRYETNDKQRNLLREFVYVDFHRWNDTRPDHVFRHRWKNFYENYLTKNHKSYSVGFAHFDEHHATCSVVLASLKCLADEYIEIRNESMYVKLDKFGWWQNMLSRISALPLQALMRWKMRRENLASFIDEEGEVDTDRDTLNPLILYPYDAGVENYISRNGINDSHVHVNLCAYAEECWLKALSNPEEECLKQQQEFDRISDAAELYRIIHIDLTPEILYKKHLETACRLRHLLICYADDILLFPPPAEDVSPDGSQAKTAEQRLYELAGIPPEQWGENHVFMWKGSPEVTHEHDLSRPPVVFAELEWMEKVIHKLAISPDAIVDRAFHLYILLMNEFLSFCVQRDNLYGFKQFQKYSNLKNTFTDQQYYYYRVFTRMHGKRMHSQTNYMELRTAPSLDDKENEENIAAILNGYFQYVKEQLRKEAPEFNSKISSLVFLLNELNELLESTPLQQRLIRPAIVPHLIKHPWNHQKGIMRHGEQRHHYEGVLTSLLNLLQNYPDLRKWLRGIDAAADELETPPDVFAPAYRMARRVLHLPHATYHAGEDFYHLISGIRTICEAVEMLDLRRGDRIGHASALGVDPHLWMRTMPSVVTPTRGEWLQDLIFTWNLLQGVHDHPELVQKLNIDIREQGYAVFRKSHLSPYILKRVFDLRHLDPETLVSVYQKAKEALQERRIKNIAMEDIIAELEESPGPIGAHEIEKQLVYEAFAREAPEVMELIIRWQKHEKTWQHSEERIEVPTDYFSVAELLLIQQLAMKKLVDNAIVIETLPSSNLRIGQYKEMGQHHSLRWLGVSKADGDIPPLVVLGSDDPGVFATDIKAEFYHIYASLRKRGLNSQEALEKVIRMDENGNRYAFRSLASNAVE